MRNDDPTKFERADQNALAAFDPRTKICVMNCGPTVGDPRSPEERRFLCQDCVTVRAAIRNQPVEPLTFDHFTNSDHREDFGPVTEGRYVLKTDYGTLQSELQLAQEERDKRMTRMMAAEKRAEQAEAERDELQKRFDAEVEAFYEERELNRRMVELMKEPSASMIAAGYPPNDERSQSWDVTEVFKAMSAQLLKEAGE